LENAKLFLEIDFDVDWHYSTGTNAVEGTVALSKEGTFFVEAGTSV